MISLGRRRASATAALACALAVTTGALATVGCRKTSSPSADPTGGSGSSAATPAAAEEGATAPAPSVSDEALARAARQAVGVLEEMAKAAAHLPDCPQIAAEWTTLLDSQQATLQEVFTLQGEAAVADRLDRAFDALSARSLAALEAISPILAACENDEAVIAARERITAALR